MKDKQLKEALNTIYTLLHQLRDSIDKMSRNQLYNAEYIRRELDFSLSEASVYFDKLSELLIED